MQQPRVQARPSYRLILPLPRLLMPPALPCRPPQLIEDLRRELEHLQLYRLETERPGGRSSASSLADFTSRTREVELEHEVKRLKQVCVCVCAHVPPPHFN